MSTNVIVDGKGKTKRRGKNKTNLLGFQASRGFAGLVDRAARDFTDGNNSKYMRQAVLDRMIEDGVVSAAENLA